METENKTKKYIMMVPHGAIMQWLHLTGQLPGGSVVDIMDAELELQPQFIRDEISILLDRAIEKLDKARRSDAQENLTDLICCISKLTAALRSNRYSDVHASVKELVNP